MYQKQKYEIILVCMKNETKRFTDEEIASLKLTTLGRKYNCTSGYVGQVLSGEREANTILARKIYKDAEDILEILNRQTKITI